MSRHRAGFHLKLWLGLALPTFALIWYASVMIARKQSPPPPTNVVRGATFREVTPPISKPATRLATQPADQPPRGSAAASSGFPQQTTPSASPTGDGSTPPAAPLPAPTGDGKYQAVPFEVLASFLYLQPMDLPGDDPTSSSSDAESEVVNKIPAAIKAYDGKLIAVTGFMMPTAVREQGVQSFLLVRDPMLCCWGMKLAMMNEWIRVDMVEGKFASYAKHVPALVKGRISIGEEFSDGYLLSIYRLVADDVELLGGY